MSYSNPELQAAYEEGIADFVGEMSVRYRKHTAQSCKEDMLLAVGHFGIDPARFYDEPEEQERIRLEAELYMLTGLVY